MTTKQDEPSIEELEEDLRRAVDLWGDDCTTAEALRKVIREMKKCQKVDDRQASKRRTCPPEHKSQDAPKEGS